MGKINSLITSFLKVGLIGFGGGSALIPVVEKELVTDKKIISVEEYNDYVIVANITPGTLPVKLAAAIGKQVGGVTGMLASAVAISFPSVFAVILLFSFVSMLDTVWLSRIEYLAIGISVFIIYLLVKYIIKVMKSCYKEGTLLPGLLIMFLVFAFTGEGEFRKLSGIGGNSLFDISTIKILMLSFFVIFYNCTGQGKIHIIVTIFISTLYLFGNGKGKLINSEIFMNILYVIMVMLSVYGLTQSVRENNRAQTESVKVSKFLKEEAAYFVFMFLAILPLVICMPELISLLGKGAVSTVISFGGGEAYLTIANGMFVESGMVKSEQFYSQLLPIANALPGPILSKLLAGVGYIVGNAANGFALEGFYTAFSCYIISICASGMVFSLVFFIYKKYSGLQVFCVLKKWILPIICGLLLSTMLSILCEIDAAGQRTEMMSGFIWAVAAIVLAVVIIAEYKLKWQDIFLIILSGGTSLVILEFMI